MYAFGPDGSEVASLYVGEKSTRLAGADYTGRKVAVITPQNQPALWFLDTGAVELLGNVPPQTDTWFRPLVSAAGRHVAVGGYQGSATGIWMYDLATGTRKFHQVPFGGARSVTPTAISGIDARYVDYQGSGMFRLDRLTGVSTETGNGYLASSPNGRFVMRTGVYEGGMTSYSILDVTTGTARTLRISTAAEYSVSVPRGAIISDDGRTIFRAVHAFWMRSGQLVDGAAGYGTVELGAQPIRPGYADVLRLYQAFFLREPDVSGAFYWTGHYSAGTSFGAIADGFALSDEFRRTYASLDAGAYVDRVYENILGREPDEAGRSYWLSKLESGELTRGRLVASFAASDEFRSQHPYSAMPGS